MNENAKICEVCGAAYMPYGTQSKPEPNSIELTFRFPNGKGLQKIAKYQVCECCMYAVKSFLEGAIGEEDLFTRG